MIDLEKLKEELKNQEFIENAKKKMRDSIKKNSDFRREQYFQTEEKYKPVMRVVGSADGGVPRYISSMQNSYFWDHENIPSEYEDMQRFLRTQGSS